MGKDSDPTIVYTSKPKPGRETVQVDFNQVVEALADVANSASDGDPWAIGVYRKTCERLVDYKFVKDPTLEWCTVVPPAGATFDEVSASDIVRLAVWARDSDDLDALHLAFEAQRGVRNALGRVAGMITTRRGPWAHPSRQ